MNEKNPCAPKPGEEVTLGILAERIGHHHAGLMQSIKTNEKQHKAIGDGMKDLGDKISIAIGVAHRRIDRIWITAVGAALGLAASSFGVTAWVIIEWAPWK